MQSQTKSAAEHRSAKPSILGTAAYIYKENGLRGLYRGVSPRICLGIWQTVCIWLVVLLTNQGLHGIFC